MNRPQNLHTQVRTCEEICELFTLSLLSIPQLITRQEEVLRATNVEFDFVSDVRHGELCVVTNVQIVFEDTFDLWTQTGPEVTKLLVVSQLV